MHINSCFDRISAYLGSEAVIGSTLTLHFGRLLWFALASLFGCF